MNGQNLLRFEIFFTEPVWFIITKMEPLKVLGSTDRTLSVHHNWEGTSESSGLTRQNPLRFSTPGQNLFDFLKTYV